MPQLAVCGAHIMRAVQGRSLIHKQKLSTVLHLPHRGLATRTRCMSAAAQEAAWPTNLDAIVVLAGGQTTSGSGLPPWVERRLDVCQKLQGVQSQPEACPILCLGGGTPHKPPIMAGEYVYHESSACADYLIQKGCSPNSLLKEVSSYDTVGNAFFSLTIHAIPANWKKLGVVTSDFHMPRTMALFSDMYQLAAQDLFGDPKRYSLHFVGASDDGIFEEDILQARHDKEAESVKTWENNFSSIKSLPNLHAWLHVTHLCYAVSRQHEFSKSTITDPRLLASY